MVALLLYSLVAPSSLLIYNAPPFVSSPEAVVVLLVTVPTYQRFSVRSVVILVHSVALAALSKSSEYGKVLTVSNTMVSAGQYEAVEQLCFTATQYLCPA